MIVFTLDALADDSHRRHFIDPSKIEGLLRWQNLGTNEFFWAFEKENGTLKRWQPDYAAYYDACDGDKPIKPTIKIINELHGYDYYDTMEDVHLWSGLSELVRSKAVQWLEKNGITYNWLKLRPIGDERPQEQLFEEWVNEECADMILAEIKQRPAVEHHVEMVFSSHKPTIEMFRKRGVFVFDCNQGEMNEVELL